jgi:putative NIF3 family GTP cyclohydrolase 1 type 2
MSLRECCELVKEKFQLDGVKVFGDLDKKVKCVAISPGSGKHMTELALEKGADVFVTSEIDHHEGIDAVSQGMAIIDAGHYGLEHIFVEDIAGFLQAMQKDLEVFVAPKAHPFQLI